MKTNSNNRRIYPVPQRTQISYRKSKRADKRRLCNRYYELVLCAERRLCRIRQMVPYKGCSFLQRRYGNRTAGCLLNLISRRFCLRCGKNSRRTGIADCLAFGAETDDITALKATADILCRQPEEYRNSLKTHLSDGLSFPAARALSLVENGISGCILSQPNNILAVEYMKALQLFSSTIDRS